MSAMPVGVVSNCFKSQIDAGQPLGDLIGQASQRGFSVIELRQGCLGDCESENELVPDPDRLQALVESCPGLQWDLALGYPCFDPTTSGDDPVFVAGCESIGRLSHGDQVPHLRLVDLSTDHATVDVADAAQTVGHLLERVREVGGMLSIEHARESWEWFSEVFARAREAAGDNGQWLKICFDPCNLLMAPGCPDPAQVTADLDPDAISMIHIKQRRDGRPWPAVAEGEVDWPEVISAIDQMGQGRGFHGPLLFEVAPSRDIWEFLDGSRVYLSRLGLDMGLGTRVPGQDLEAEQSGEAT
jgi:sugar phosphate isomerase/epimerase